ncbi:hypothetical protein Csa_014116 [Cucumis sativus]|uniref:Uncharacterized protein n=1 Tax=Cucumis sativus TaxID=3659 RepID=A0A0A0LRR5_CUCSA|nr:hypothetical protein Csa_014116 [Cucumis sativus]
MLPFSQQEEDAELISTLNRHATPSSSWKIRTNQLAYEEIRTERRAAIASGNLKARRLSYDDAIDMSLHLNTNFLLHGDYLDESPQDDDQMIPSSDPGEEKAEQVCLNALSYSCASSSSSSGKFVPLQMKEQMAAKAEVEENVRAVVGEIKMETRNGCKIGNWKVGLACLAIASVPMVIFSLRCLGLHDEEEQFPFLLVPT